MSTQRYLYWHPAPDDVEFLDGTFYRWTVTEAEWRTHHYCQAYDITVPEGWRVVGFREPKNSESFLNECGEAVILPMGEGACFDCLKYDRKPILERVEEWSTPTDEDAKRRPAVQVQNYDDDADTWEEATLLAVVKSGAPYVVMSERGYVTAFGKCQMKKENKA